MSVWDDRKADIVRMVEEGFIDQQIGMVYGASGAEICRVRKSLGIASTFKQGSKSFRAAINAHDPEIPPLVGETYVDKAGLTVTRYPARWADGALVQSVTARPRRG